LGPVQPIFTVVLAVGPNHGEPFEDAALTGTAAPTPTFNNTLVVLIADHFATFTAGFGMERIADIAHANQDIGTVPAVSQRAIFFLVLTLDTQLFVTPVAREFDFSPTTFT
jgi:hypothetical protein